MSQLMKTLTLCACSSDMKEDVVTTPGKENTNEQHRGAGRPFD